MSTAEINARLKAIWSWSETPELRGVRWLYEVGFLDFHGFLRAAEHVLKESRSLSKPKNDQAQAVAEFWRRYAEAFAPKEKP